MEQLFLYCPMEASFIYSVLGTIHPPKHVPHAKTQGASVDALTNASIEAGDGPKALIILLNAATVG